MFENTLEKLADCVAAFSSGDAEREDGPELNELEQRVCFSAVPVVGDLAGVAVVNEPLVEVSQSNAVTPETSLEDSTATVSDDAASADSVSEADQTSELIIIDAGVPDKEGLRSEFKSLGIDTSQIFLLDADQDGIQQVTSLLQEFSNVSAIHIISHGESGAFQLGNVEISNANVLGYAQQLTAWQSSLATDADLLLYGCDLAASADGIELMEQLALATGADVAGSDDATGHENLDADWILEFSTGAVDTVVALNEGFATGWTYTLSVDAPSFIFSTENNVDTSGSNIGGINSWQKDDAIALSGTDLSFATGGGMGGDYSVFAESLSDTKKLQGLHVVGKDMMLFNDSVEVKEGDILFTSEDHTFDGMSGSKHDIFRYRASDGSYDKILVNPLNDELRGFTLVESNTTIGDTLVEEGSLLLSRKGGSEDDDIWLYADLGSGWSGTSLVDLDSGDFNMNGQIRGLELIENDITVGGVNLKSGQIIITWNGDETLPGGQGTASDADAFVIDLTTTGTNATGSAFHLFDGDSADIAGDRLNAVALISNDTGVVNAAPVANADTYTIDENTSFKTNGGWWDTAWSYRLELAIDNASSTTDLTNQPVLVTLDASRIDYSQVQDAGEDLRFVDGDGTILNYEIEVWDESGVSQVWVEVPQIDAGSTSDSIQMYYGNSAASAGASSAATWGSGYVLAHHLTNPSLDSTLPAANAYSSNTTTVSGVVGDAQSFNGSSSYINLGSDAKYDDVFDGGGTVSAWINASSWGEAGHGRIIDKAPDRIPSPSGWSLAVDESTGGGRIAFERGFSDGYGRWLSGVVLDLNSWHNIVVSYDSSSVSNDPVFYLDGVQISVFQVQFASGTSISDAGLDLAIGNQITNLNRTFDGVLDEVRLEDGIKSSDEVASDFATVQGTMVSYGAEESAGISGVLDNDTDPENDALAATLVNGPTNAQSFSLNPDGSFEYAPIVGFSGVDSFEYEVSDGDSTSTATATINVTGHNFAPVLDDSASFTILEVIEGNSNPVGSSVDELIGSGGVNVIADSDPDDPQGIVVTNVDDSNGTWEFTTNGVNWTAFSSAGGSGSSNVNVLLEGDDRVRFVASEGYVGSAGNITFRAWDQSSGAAGDGDVDLMSTGGNSAFSNEEASATTDVLPSGGFTVSVPPAQFTAQGAPITFTIADGNVVTFDDGLAGDALVRLELTANDGNLTILHTSGITFDEGTSNNSSNLIVYGIKSEVSQALEDLTFTPDGGFSGGATISVEVGTYAGAVGSYGFEDSTGSDSSPSGNHAMLDPTMAFNDVERGNVIQFDGTQQFTIPNNFGQTTDFSVASWVNFDSSDANQELIAIGDGVRITQFTEANGGLTALYNVDGTWHELNSGITMPQGEWHHIGFTFDDGQQRLLIDGVEVASDAVSGSVNYNGINSTVLGEDPSGVGRSFTGMIDDFEVNAAVLSSEQFGAIFNGADTVSSDFVVNVAEPPPGVVDDSVSVNEGATISIAVLGNDTVTYAAIDPSTLDVISGPSNGSLVVAADGTVSYTHDGGESTSDEFRYRVADVDGRVSSDATVSITVVPVNDVPVASDDSFTVIEGQTHNQSVSVFANDSDPDGPAVSGNVVTGPDRGTLTWSTDGTFIYEHDGSESTTDQFTYEIDDGDGGTDEATVFITITPENDAPIAVDDSFSLDEGAVHTDLIGVLNNDTDVDGPSATATVVSLPSNGTLVFNNDGTFTYTHGGGEALSDQFTYELNDGAGGVNQATVFVAINPINDVPVAQDDNLSVSEGDTLTQNTSVFDNDTDPDGPSATGSIVSGPTHGTLNWHADGTFVYEHDGSESTSDEFTYELVDGDGGSDEAVVRITVDPVNDAPIANDDEQQANAATTVTISQAELLANDTDAESDATSIVVLNQPLNGSVTVDGSGDIVYVADDGFTGEDSFTYVITDGVDTSNPATVTLSVVLPPPPPVLPATDPESDQSGDTSSDTDVEDSVDVGGEFEQPEPAVGGESDSGEDDDEVIAPPIRTDLEPELQIAVRRSVDAEVVQSNNGLIKRLGLIGKRVAGTSESISFVVDATTQILKSGTPLSETLIGASLGQALDGMEDELDTELLQSQITVGTIVASSATLTVGLVYWGIRAGYIAAGVLTSVPAWKVFDPSSLATLLEGDDESIQDVLAGA